MRCRGFVAALVCAGATFLIMEGECRALRTEHARVRAELERLRLPSLAGPPEDRRRAASVVAAKARVLIADLQAWRGDEQVGPHVRVLLARIAEAAR